MVQSSPRRSLGEVNILSANKSRFCSAATHTASPTTALLLLYLSFSLSLSLSCLHFFLSAPVIVGWPRGVEQGVWGGLGWVGFGGRGLMKMVMMIMMMVAVVVGCGCCRMHGLDCLRVPTDGLDVVAGEHARLAVAASFPPVGVRVVQDLNDIAASKTQLSFLLWVKVKECLHICGMLMDLKKGERGWNTS